MTHWRVLEGRKVSSFLLYFIDAPTDSHERLGPETKVGLRCRRSAHGDRKSPLRARSLASLQPGEF